MVTKWPGFCNFGRKLCDFSFNCYIIVTEHEQKSIDNYRTESGYSQGMKDSVSRQWCATASDPGRAFS